MSKTKKNDDKMGTIGREIVDLDVKELIDKLENPIDMIEKIIECGKYD